MVARGRPPFLDLSALRRANTDGELSMVCLSSGMPEHLLGLPAGHEAQDRIVEQLYYLGGGYRLKEYFIDAYAPWQNDWALAAGFRLCNDHAAHYAACEAPQRAQLYAVTRDEALAWQGSIVAPVFRYEQPCFAFTPVEQELLFWALTEMTDDELAEELGVALITVRKRWERIYDRVLFISPELFPAGAQTNAQKRGAEKKRRLLHYLRYHIEELRPVLPPRKRVRRSSLLAPA